MATKEPDVKVLFTRVVTRYRVDPSVQLNLLNEPKVEPYTYAIAAYYCIPMNVVRLHVGGAADAWRLPVVIEGGDYEAVTEALIDLGGATGSLPYFETAEIAVEKWRNQQRARIKGEDVIP